MSSLNSPVDQHAGDALAQDGDHVEVATLDDRPLLERAIVQAQPAAHLEVVGAHIDVLELPRTATDRSVGGREILEWRPLACLHDGLRGAGVEPGVDGDDYFDVGGVEVDGGA